jgi:hypothetical protein
MARPLSPHRKILVEECEDISVSTAVGNLAIGGISFEYTRGAAVVSGDGFAAQDVDGASSSYIGHLAHRSSPVVGATISHTSACKTKWAARGGIPRWAATAAGTAAEIRPRPIGVWTFDIGNEAACCALGDSSCGSGRLMVT